MSGNLLSTSFQVVPTIFKKGARIQFTYLERLSYTKIRAIPQLFDGVILNREHVILVRCQHGGLVQLIPELDDVKHEIRLFRFSGQRFHEYEIVGSIIITPFEPESQ
jgi:hypothetical protein